MNENKKKFPYIKIKNKIYILAPIVRDRKGEYKKEIEDIKRKGFQRVKIDNEIYDIEDVPILKKNFKHNIDIVVDRLLVKKEIQQRIAGSVETALGLSEGLIYIENFGDMTFHIRSDVINL